MHGPLDQPVPLNMAECLGEHLLAHPFDELGQSREAQLPALH